MAHMTLQQQDRDFLLRTRSVCPSGHRCWLVTVIVMVPWGRLMSLYPRSLTFSPPKIGQWNVIFQPSICGCDLLVSLDLFIRWFFTDSTMVNHDETTIWGIFLEGFSKHQTRKSRVYQKNRYQRWRYILPRVPKFQGGSFCSPPVAWWFYGWSTNSPPPHVTPSEIRPYDQGLWKPIGFP